MLKAPACILRPIMVVPVLSDTQLYDQKEHYSHKQLYSLLCRSSLFKLLHFFWSPLGVGFLLSCHCLLKFSGTLRRSSLVSSILFCPLYIFCPLYSFYETEARNEFWKSYSNQVGLQHSYVIIKEHLPCLFKSNMWVGPFPTEYIYFRYHVVFVDFPCKCDQMRP